MIPINLITRWEQGLSITDRTRFSAYNLHLNGLDKYWNIDNHLRLLKEQPYVYRHPLINEIPTRPYSKIKISGVNTPLS